MKNSQKIICLIILNCFLVERHCFILDKIRGAIKPIKCKLHTFGNSIIPHEHKHGDLCDSNEHKPNDFGSENGYKPNLNEPHNNAHDSHEHFNGHSYGGDNTQSGSDEFSSNVKDKYVLANNLNDNTENKDISNHLDHDENILQERKKGDIINNEEKEEGSDGEYVKKDLNDKPTPEKKARTTDIPKKSKHKKYHGDNTASEENISEEISMEEQTSSSVPKIDLRSDAFDEALTPVPVPEGGGKNLGGVKCNGGVEVRGGGCHQAI